MSTHARRRSNWPRLDILISLCRGAHSNPKNDTNICFVKESKCSEAQRRITQIPQQTYNFVIWKAPTTTSSTLMLISNCTSFPQPACVSSWQKHPSALKASAEKQAEAVLQTEQWQWSSSTPILLELLSPHSSRTPAVRLTHWSTSATNFRTKQKTKRDPSKQREPVFVQPLSAYIHGHSTYKYIWSCPPCHVLQQEEHEICSVPLCLTGSNWDLVVEKKSC